MDIYVKLKYINEKHPRGILKFFDWSGIRKRLEVYLKDDENNLVPYMTSTLVKEAGWWMLRDIESVMRNGDVYNIKTKYIRSKSFWKCNGRYTGNIIHNEIEIAQIDFFPNNFLTNSKWQVLITLNSGEKFVLSPWERENDSLGIQLLHGNRSGIRIEKDNELLMELEEKYHYPKEPAKIGFINKGALQPELLLLVPIYYYILFPDYIDDHDVPP
jgi:hypothetical protein